MGLRLSDDQIQRAKEVDILEYLMCHETDNLVKCGSAYHLKDHDSLTISNGKWYWHSQGFGDVNALNFLIKVRGYAFADAVERLAGADYSQIRSIVPKSNSPPRKSEISIKKIKLPLHNQNNNRVLAYLQSRGISKNLIIDCINSGILYESAVHHNCVFLGKDERGKTRFAAMRGTFDGFKQDAFGSDKRYGFCLSGNSDKSDKCDTVAVFESPIDVLSHKTIYPNCDCYRLSLGGTSLNALTHFLEQHKEINQITVCTDNDEAGNLCAENISKLDGYCVERQAPLFGKDRNDTLIEIQKRERKQTQTLQYERGISL